MRLKHITFTGVDARTDIKALQEIQEQYPIAEFGVLTSYHWYENGNRYLDPLLIEEKLRGDLRGLSLHVCGRAAHDAAYGNWNKVDKLVWMNLGIFNRVQLNIANRKDNPTECKLSKIVGQEVIIQSRDADNTELYEDSLEAARGDKHNRTFSTLLDASGGEGIDTPIKIYPSDGKIGYAGGINPDNVGDKLAYLLENVKQGSFWIDMESGVRTDDWFDVNKVSRVLAICKEVMRELHVEEG